MEESLERMLVESGEKQRLEELVHQRLRECGWFGKVEELCLKKIEEKGVENVNGGELIAEITPEARHAVPESVKREVADKVRKFVQTQTQLRTADL